jgi:predicted  nucleic acid-binding Zn-ribbon protein
VIYCTDTPRPSRDTGYIATSGLFTVDDRQRKSLSHEVQSHHARIVELEETLQELEQNLKQVVDAPEELRLKVDRLRMELKGRYAAFSVGTAHLSAYHA